MKPAFFLVVVSICLLIPNHVQAQVPVLRGDVNGSGGVNITDVVYLNNFLFAGGPAPPCMDAADVNNDGAVNITDSVYLANYLFNGGPAPNPRFANCP